MVQFGSYFFFRYFSALTHTHTQILGHKISAISRFNPNNINLSLWSYMAQFSSANHLHLCCIYPSITACSFLIYSPAFSTVSRFPHPSPSLFFRCWFGTLAQRNHTLQMSPNIGKTLWWSRCEKKGAEQRILKPEADCGWPSSLGWD